MLSLIRVLRTRPAEAPSSHLPTPSSQLRPMLSGSLPPSWLRFHYSSSGVLQQPLHPQIHLPPWGLEQSFANTLNLAMSLSCLQRLPNRLSLAVGGISSFCDEDFLKTGENQHTPKGSHSCTQKTLVVSPKFQNQTPKTKN